MTDPLVKVVFDAGQSVGLAVVIAGIATWLGFCMVAWEIDKLRKTLDAFFNRPTED